MINSMTAFANQSGSHDGLSWQWEMRGVNARGLDLRLRLPDMMSDLEQHVRTTLAKHLKRGNITISLRLSGQSGEAGLQIDDTQLDRVLAALDQVQERAFAMGVTLGQPTAADVLNTKGVMTTAQDDRFDESLAGTLQTDFATLITAFCQMRADEGAALTRVISDQLGQLETLIASAARTANERSETARDTMKSAMARVMDNTDGLDETRITQELAILAVKSDITEEIDRLNLHVTAARALLNDGNAIGRKLDFLCQEFNREANTLCSKANAAGLTAIGLDIKAVIEQMREQTQNVE
jgi:uncharacterized protein (TIGR00255 family)